jgi:hypothetical protein
MVTLNLMERTAGDRNGHTIFALDFGFVVIDPVASDDGVKEKFDFRVQMLREKRKRWTAQHFALEVAEDSFGTSIPCGDPQVGVVAEERVVGDLQDYIEQGQTGHRDEGMSFRRARRGCGRAV